jgi:hypothetical protein
MASVPYFGFHFAEPHEMEEVIDTAVKKFRFRQGG